MGEATRGVKHGVGYTALLEIILFTDVEDEDLNVGVEAVQDLTQRLWLDASGEEGRGGVGGEATVTGVIRHHIS